MIHHMRKSQAITIAALGLAAFLMLVSLFNETVTLASQDYRAALATALGTMILADLLCMPSLLRRGRERWIAILIALPLLFILWDFASRAHFVFSRKLGHFTNLKVDHDRILGQFASPGKEC